MVRADLESLIPPHDQARLLVLLVLQQSNIAGPALLPLLRLAVELEQLGAHLETLLFQLLICPGIDFLGQMDDGFIVRVSLGFGFAFLSDVNPAFVSIQTYTQNCFKPEWAFTSRKSPKTTDIGGVNSESRCNEKHVGIKTSPNRSRRNQETA